MTVIKKIQPSLSVMLIRLFSSPGLATARLWLPLSLKRRVRSALERRAIEGLRFHRTPEWLSPAASGDNALSATSPGIPSVVPADRGVNLYGYFSRWLGLGECARLYGHAMLSAGYPFTLHDVDIDIPHHRHDSTLDRYFSDSSPFKCDLIFVNPDHWVDTLRSIDHQRRPDHHVIGYWFWELEQFPETWLHALDNVDEIMVSSAFVEQSLRRVCDKPITCVPLPVVLGEDSGLQRTHFELEEDAFIFFCSFDFNSGVARKNPFAVIEAFCLAFPAGDEKVALLIKSSNGDRHGISLDQLLALASVDKRIVVKNDMLERRDLQALHRCIDVFVSLHRSEGFGLGIAEAMCMGKPVVATAYSGNMDFMTSANSCMVDYRMIDVQPGEYPHAGGQRWAHPDPRHAANHFYNLYSDRELGRRLGAQAAIDMARDFSIEACMAVISERLKLADVERGALA